MPELPELDVVCEVLARRVAGRTITSVTLDGRTAPIVVRDLTFTQGQSLVNARIVGATRRGKFIVIALAPGPFVIINPKLTGRLQLATSKDRRFPKTVIVLGLDDGQELRYFDQKQMGQIYIGETSPDAGGQIPGYSEQGPEPYALTSEVFATRLRTFQGEIKGILCRGECVAGIGNAYADEILWAARIHPYRRRASLTPHEVTALHEAMVSTLRIATDRVRADMGDNIHLKPREFLSVHMRAGQPCPRCGATIAEISANQRITNFCRTCQPGGLIKGMA